MSVMKEMVAAGPGCAVANGLLNGLETTKVKMQLHNATRPVYANASSMRGVMTQIVREEGILTGLLVPGLSASLTRSMVYGAYRVGLYSSTRDWMSNSHRGNSGSDDDPTLVHRMASGMVTGGLGALLTCPLDVVRTRAQADSGNICSEGRYTTGLRKGLAVRYTSVTDALWKIGQQEGVRSGLYRGAGVTITRASLLNGSQLASYDTLKRQLDWQEGPLFHVVCAFGSGIIAQTVIMPIDTIKSTMMVGHTPAEVWQKLVRNGLSPQWLYRGYVPACAGQGMIMVLQMPLIEEFRRLLGVKAI